MSFLGRNMYSYSRDAEASGCPGTAEPYIVQQKHQLIKDVYAPLDRHYEGSAARGTLKSTCVLCDKETRKEATYPTAASQKHTPITSERGWLCAAIQDNQPPIALQIPSHCRLRLSCVPYRMSQDAVRAKIPLCCCINRERRASCQV